MSVIEPFVRWWRSAARRPQRSLSAGANPRTRRRRWIERFSDRSRRVTTAILRAQQEATLDGILIIDAAGKIVSYNRRFLELWRIPVEVARSGKDSVLLEAVQNLIVDWESFIALVQHLYDHPLEVRSNDIIELTDGRIFARTTSPVLSGRKIIGRAWYFRDITEARRNETLQSALFRISEVAHSAASLEELYGSIHRIVGELMDVTNFYIATVDDNGLLWFPYFVDQYDAAPPVALNPGRGLTGYVMRTGRSLLVEWDPLESTCRHASLSIL